MIIPVNTYELKFLKRLVSWRKVNNQKKKKYIKVYVDTEIDSTIFTQSDHKCQRTAK